MGFIRALLIILIIFLVLRLAGRLLFAWGVSKSAKMGNNGSDGSQRGKDGDVYIKYKPDKEGKIINKDDGDYIKFEDVDED